MEDKERVLGIKRWFSFAIELILNDPFGIFRGLVYDNVFVNEVLLYKYGYMMNKKFQLIPFHL